MKITEQEIKKILKDDYESPSFAFSSKTIRLIEEKQNSDEAYIPLQISRWIFAGVFSVFVLGILYSFTIDAVSFPYSIQFTLPSFSGFRLWGLALFGMAIGLWIWILLIQTGKVKL